MSSNKKKSTPNNPNPPTSNGSGAKPSKPNAWSRPLKTTTTPPPTKTPPLSRQNTPPPPPGYKAQDAGPQMTAADELQLRAGHRERALHMWLNLVGTKVSLHLTTGSILEGIFHTATPLPMAKASMRNKYVLKAVQVVKKGEEDKEDIAPGSIVVLDMKKVVQMHVKSLPKTASLGHRGNNAAFTDTEISGAAMQSDKERELQEAGSAWTTPNANGSGGSHESGGRAFNSRAQALGGGSGEKATTAGGLAGDIGGWDQFKANEKLFNVKGSFDESLYTTSLDKKAFSARAIAKAERLAKEIEGTVATNWHMAEERNQKVQGDYDEEDLYSGVLPEAKATAAAPASAPPNLSYAKVAKSLSEEKEVSKTPGVKTEEDKGPAAAKEDAAKAAETAPDLTEEKPSTRDKTEKESAVKQPEKSEGNVKKDSTTKSTLNPGAKEFTFNANAREFTPKFSAPSAEPQQMPPPPIDPNTGMPIHMQHHLPPGQGGASPYMQQPQQGMMPMMSPPYGIRYPTGPYPGMETPMHMQQPPQPPQQQPSSAPPSGGAPPLPSAHTSGTSSPVGDGSSAPGAQEDGGAAQDGESGTSADDGQQANPQGTAPPPQQGHPGMAQQPMPYGMHPQYYNAQMGMPPRPVQGYPQHMIPHQQMPNPMFRQMYPVPGGHPGMMPAPMQYYGGGGGPMGYPGYYEDEMGYRGGPGGRARGRGRAGRPGRGRGRLGERGAGRGRFNQHHQPQGGSGRSTPDDSPNPNPPPEPQPQDGETAQPQAPE